MWLVLISNLFALHVVIDPGHGGVDSGATYYGLKEKEITLSISKKLIKLIEQDKSIQASLTRTSDQRLGLKQRSQKAEKNNSDLFISIHTNSSPDKRAKGVEIYFENQLSADEDSLFLAYREEQLGQDKYLSGRPSKFRSKYTAPVSAILDDLAKTKYLEQSYQFANLLKNTWQKEDTTNVRIRQAPFYVVSSVNMPSVLVEVGFISNTKEAKALRDKTYQMKIAQIIYKAVKDWNEQWTLYKSSL